MPMLNGGVIELRDKIQSFFWVIGEKACPGVMVDINHSEAARGG
jgi:hypothetical protein